MSDDYYIKKEDGKEVVYRKGILGYDGKVGELHENWDGSKETRNFFGPKVEVERDTFSTRISGERNASVDGEAGKFSRDSVFGYELRNSPSFKSNQREDRGTSDNQGSSSSYSNDSYATRSVSEIGDQAIPTGIHTLSTGMKWALFWTMLTETASLLRLKKLEKGFSNILSSVYSSEGYFLRAAEYAERAGDFEKAIEYLVLYHKQIGLGGWSNAGDAESLARKHSLEGKLIEFYRRADLYKEAAEFAESVNRIEEASECYRIAASSACDDGNNEEADSFTQKSKELEAKLKNKSA